MRITNKVRTVTVFQLLATAAMLSIGTLLFAAECPTDAVLSVDCSDADAIAHIRNTHCNDPADPGQFSEYYCEDLVATCTEATTSPDAKYPDNCYKKGEEGEIVGNLPDGSPTNCYQANFVPGKGVGTMILKTMYPVKDAYCTQH